MTELAWKKFVGDVMDRSYDAIAIISKYFFFKKDLE